MLERRLFLVLRVAAAMCFVGHGAFGILTKPAWLAYFAVVGIGPDLGYRLMPVIGAVDMLLGLSMLVWPTRAALAYMTFWAVLTAFMRPLAGQGFPEFLERAGNYGVPFAMLLMSAPGLGWLDRLVPQRLGNEVARPIAGVLRLTTALLLAGHGLLALGGKPLLVKHLAAVELGPAHVPSLGLVELALAAAVLVAPAAPLLLAIVAWKVATEFLFVVTGDPVWEFVERGGSYGAPLPLALITAPQRSTRRIPAPSSS